MTGAHRAYFCPPLQPGTLRLATLFAAAAQRARLEVVVALSQRVADLDEDGARMATGRKSAPFKPNSWRHQPGKASSYQMYTAVPARISISPH